MSKKRSHAADASCENSHVTRQYSSQRAEGKQLNLELYARHLKDKEIFPDVKTNLRQDLQTRHS